MPLIHVKTSAQLADRAAADALLVELSAQLAQQLGKSEAYVMTALEDDVPMTFGGRAAPACYIEIKSIGTMPPEQTKAMSQVFCERVTAHLGVAGDRTYIEFSDVTRSMWGWNGSTFG
ncbi:MAG: phenylpyruvate tautomerase MIF-related protein [Geitlerinemataceae cyanobacterium]